MGWYGFAFNKMRFAKISWHSNQGIVNRMDRNNRIGSDESRRSGQVLEGAEPRSTQACAAAPPLQERVRFEPHAPHRGRAWTPWVKGAMPANLSCRSWLSCFHFFRCTMVRHSFPLRVRDMTVSDPIHGILCPPKVEPTKRLGTEKTKVLLKANLYKVLPNPPQENRSQRASTHQQPKQDALKERPWPHLGEARPAEA